MTAEQREANEFAAAAAYWSGRLDGFCAELESKGFRIERDGLSVRIELPDAPASPEPAPRRLCAHADQDGRGMHWLDAGAKCDRR